MMEGMMNQMRRAASEVMSGQAVTRHGTVDGYDAANYAVKVKLQPDGTLTDWLPLKSAWIGNGWGMFLAPSIGDAVEIDFQEGNGGVGSAGWRFFNDSERPLSVPSGEAWLVHKSGASIKLTNDGKLTLADGAGATIALGGGTITSAGNWTHTGAFTSSGEVTGNGKHLSTHTHSDPQGGSTGTPV
jgi:hypothetical protein